MAENSPQKEISQILKLLSNKLEETEATVAKLERALSHIFPFELYKTLRKDIFDKYENDAIKIIRHYANHAINEINLKEAIEAKSNHISKKIVQDYFHNQKIFSRNIHEAYIKEALFKFSKTNGTIVEISQNTAHEFARNHTIIHLKSNSICTWIPKIGCSSLRLSFAMANGAINDIQNIQWIHQNNSSFVASNKELLKANYSFVILRNPFKRILSFFLDKICHSVADKVQDNSYNISKNIFKTNDQTTFESFVNLIWNNPQLIEEDEHTRAQCDFLVYERYSDYFALEEMNTAVDNILKKTGVKLIDCRDLNTIYTTKGLKKDSIFSPITTAREVKSLIEEGKAPLTELMYTDEMVKKIGTLYFSDIILYLSVVKESSIEMGEWLFRLAKADGKIW